MRRRLFKNLLSEPCTEPLSPQAPGDLETLGAELRGAVARRLGRSLAIREVDAGSCNACVGAVSKVVPVDLVIRGCPPTPVQLLQGLLWLMTGADNAAASAVMS